MTVWDHRNHATTEPPLRNAGTRNRRSAAIAVAIASSILWLLTFGFAVFATAVMRDDPGDDQIADGIVVLTGGDYRISEGARLLSEGRGRRLLISGINAKTSKDDLQKLSGLDNRMFDCCVDLGYLARDTIGNADETKAWASSQHFGSLIVVTSSYHMPRSVAELTLAMPETKLIPFAVVPKKFRSRAWWLHPATARILLSEYVKYLPVAARLGAARLLKPWEKAAWAAAAGNARTES